MNNLADGIYFGLDEATYHAQPRLSASGIRVLLQSPSDFWWQSAMNPLREPDNDTAAKAIGRAYHCRILEGDEAFRSRYCPAITQDEHPGALVTVEDIKAALTACGEKLTGRKADLIARLQAADPGAVIWDAITAAYAEKNDGREHLPRHVWDRIQLAAAMIERHEMMGRVVRGGAAEVAVLWTDDEFGVPMKCKMDKLKPKVIVDLKAFANMLGKPFDRAVMTAFASGRYQIQAAVYLDAAKRIPDLVAAGAVHGDAPDWITAMGKVEKPYEPEFVFLFQQSTGAPIARAYRLPREGLTLDVGRVAAADARRIYRENMDRYGADMWIDTAPIRDFDDSEIPAFAFD